LPVLRLKDLLGLSTPDDATAELPNPVRIIVVTKRNRLFGFAVDEILDVLTTSDTMDDSTVDHATVMGLLINPDGVVAIVDILRVIDNYLGKDTDSAAQVAEPTSANVSGQRILFAEDTTFFRRHVCSVLEKAGYKVDTAVNGKEALDRLEAAEPGTYEAVLSDIEMPEMDGMTFARRVRAQAQFAKVPMVALTTRFSPESVAEGLAAGFTEYLEKMNAEVLLSHLKKLMPRPAGEARKS
ncbi:MAG: chemotaxis protein CheV, partial [Deltaproteobacteria bacterium]